MNKFGIPDSVIDSVNAVLEAGNKLPRQLKDPKKETMMGYEYKPGKVRNQVVDKKDVKDKEKKGYFHTEDAVDEDDIAEAMEVHLKPHGTAGTHYTVHKVGKKLAKHGGIKVGERLSDTQVDDARESGVKVRHVKEDTEQVDEFVAGMVGRTLAGMAIKPLVKMGAKAAVGGAAMAAGKHVYDKVTGRDKKKNDVKEAENYKRVPVDKAALPKDQAGSDLDAWRLKGKVKRKTVSRDKRLGKEEVEFNEDYGAHQDAVDHAKRDGVNPKKHGLLLPYSDHHMKKRGYTHRVGGEYRKGEDRTNSGTPLKSLGEGGMKRIATQAMLGEPGSGLETFKKHNAKKNNGGVKQNSSVNQDKPSNMGNLGKKQKSVPQNGSVNQNEEVIDEKKLDPVDHKALKGSHAKRKDKDIDNDGKVDDTDTYLHHRRKTVKKAMKEGVGDEKVRSSAQAAQLAKHYYAKAKQAQASGSKEEAAKMMSAAKTFYRKSEADQAQEKGGHQKARAESTENVGIGEYYFNEIEIEEIEAAEDIVTEAKTKFSGAKVGETERSGHRVTKTEKEGPEHIVMQARKVVSLGQNHSGVEFGDGSKAKVHPKHASAALNRYNQAKPADKERMQATMNHSHAGLKHVASGKPMDHPDNPHKPQARKLAGADRRTDRAVGLMKHPDD